MNNIAVVSGLALAFTLANGFYLEHKIDILSKERAEVHIFVTSDGSEVTIAGNAVKYALSSADKFKPKEDYDHLSIGRLPQELAYKTGNLEIEQSDKGSKVANSDLYYLDKALADNKAEWVDSYKDRVRLKVPYEIKDMSGNPAWHANAGSIFTAGEFVEIIKAASHD